MGFLDDWERQAMSAPGLTKTNQRRLCLSEPTMLGLRITGSFFVLSTIFQIDRQLRPIHIVLNNDNCTELPLNQAIGF